RGYIMTERFDKAAKEWDKSDMRTQLANNIGSAVVENVELTPQMHIMDFGAGTGLLAEHVAPRVAKVSAVDISQGMLDELVSKSSLQGKVVAYCQNILHEPLEADFDGIVSAMALHHVEDTEEILKVFYEHLKPGGFVALADLDREDGTFHTDGNEGIFHFGFDRGEFQSKLESAGFKHVKFHTAYTVEKENGTDYDIFLATAQK
ncbi:MAG: class I SAM-dependent methyltransferase, partial [Thiovulaceae bacterium]|nr:class I SAM-dependent methyltransferase [Sulfurimonadaceae bacterium]